LRDNVALIFAIDVYYKDCALSADFSFVRVWGTCWNTGNQLSERFRRRYYIALVARQTRH